ncbi:NADH dehydrogenase iron-sulfur protein [Striga asiatica]|uniref:NADH dehydrogenase iron-sulfur protein n=1 Tax=Striga asiatica TaxID=4170 RepID=A0A5A7QC03_STRAF|nr:NADH dehydrogenase iron-sulfur protein [Striga asiatica]
MEEEIITIRDWLLQGITQGWQQVIVNTQNGDLGKALKTDNIVPVEISVVAEDINSYTTKLQFLPYFFLSNFFSKMFENPAKPPPSIAPPPSSTSIRVLAAEDEVN